MIYTRILVRRKAQDPNFPTNKDSNQNLSRLCVYLEMKMHNFPNLRIFSNGAVKSQNSNNCARSSQDISVIVQNVVLNPRALES